MSVHWGGRGPGHISRWSTAAVSYSAEATALFARMDVQPDATRKGLIDTAIKSLKTAGVWPKIEGLWLPAAHDAQAARLNWIGSSFNLSAIASPTFTTDHGYAGDGSSSYLDTGYVPSASAIYAQDSAAIWVWMNAGDNSQASNLAAMGAIGTAASALIIPRDSGGNLVGRMNGTGTVGFGLAVTDRLGFNAISRTAVGATEGRHKTTSGTDTHSSAGVPDKSLFIGGYNNGGTPAGLINNRVAAAGVSSGLSSAELTALRSAINTYLTAIGAN